MKFLVVASVLAALAGSARADGAEKGVFGIGLIVGEPTGISAKLYLDDTHAIQAAAGSAFIGGGLQIHADYLWHPWILESRPTSFNLVAYVGPGARFIYYEQGRQSGYAATGVRAVGGLVFDFTNVPLDVFVEVAGVLEWRFSSTVSHLHPTLNAGAGVRYYF